MHVTDEELEWYISGRLPPAQSLATKTHLLECKLCKQRMVEAWRYLERLSELSRHRQGIEIERRTEFRIPTDEAASVRILAPPYATIDARARNMSKGGLALRAPEPVAPGTLVQVRLGKRIIMAEVRYCLWLGTEFHSGVRADDVVWISDRERPNPGTE